MKRLNKALIISSNLFLVKLLNPGTALAQVNIVTTYFGGNLQNRTLGDYISAFLRFAVLFAGVISFLLFIGGGLMVISGAGNPQKQQQGKSAITAAVAGFLLVFSAYWIIQLIEVLFAYPGLLDTGL